MILIFVLKNWCIYNDPCYVIGSPVRCRTDDDRDADNARQVYRLEIVQIYSRYARNYPVVKCWCYELNPLSLCLRTDVCRMDLHVRANDSNLYWNMFNLCWNSCWVCSNSMYVRCCIKNHVHVELESIVKLRMLILLRANRSLAKCLCIFVNKYCLSQRSVVNNSPMIVNW